MTKRQKMAVKIVGPMVVIVTITLVLGWPFLTSREAGSPKAASANVGNLATVAPLVLGQQAPSNGGPFLTVPQLLPVILVTIPSSCTNYHYNPPTCPPLAAHPTRGALGGGPPGLSGGPGPKLGLPGGGGGPARRPGPPPRQNFPMYRSGGGGGPPPGSAGEGTAPTKELPGSQIPTNSEGSFIQNSTFSFYHTALDFGFGTASDAGCSSCSSTGISGSGLPELEIVRRHRFRDQTEPSSFGPAVFSNYDIHLYLHHSGDGTTDTIDIFDPQDPSPRRLTLVYDEQTSGPLMGTFYDQLSRAIKEVRLLDAGGNLETDHGTAVAAELRSFHGHKFLFELFSTTPPIPEWADSVSYATSTVVIHNNTHYFCYSAHTSDAATEPGVGMDWETRWVDIEMDWLNNPPPVVLNGRLTAITDRNGYGIELSYQEWTTQEIEESPERQWQIDTVTDSYGRVATFTYAAQQVSGRWVVEEIELPGSQVLEYEYSNGNLSKVVHPDASESTFTFTPETTSQTTIAAIVDPAAGRSEEVYLTNNFVIYDDMGLGMGVMNQSSQLVRMVVNGEDEVHYFNMRAQGGETEHWIYEGGGQLKFIHGTQWAWYYTDWDLEQDEMTEDWFIDGDQETSYAWRNGAATLMNASTVTNDQGITTNHTYDDDVFPTQTTYSDQTTETTTYNDFKQVTRFKDRENHVTLYTYDTQGNLLTKEVGLTDDGNGGETQENEYAIYEWEYYPAQHANEFMLKASIDANGNQTDYEYDTNNRLTKIIEPPDNSGGARAETVYTYDMLGRLATVTDPEDRETSYDYDSKNRIVKVTYDDSSTERTIYGTGFEANLVYRQKDRNGVVTEYDYDDDGRLIKTIYAAGTMDLSDNFTAITNPSVRVEEICTYVPGKNLRASCTRAGDKTEYAYDYHGRLIETTTYPNTNTSLTTSQTYLNNKLFSVSDPYGRKQFFAYRSSDGERIREVQFTIPGAQDTPGDFTDVLNLTRGTDPDPNGAYVITDYEQDANGNTIETVDGRGISRTVTYDSRDRLIEQLSAAGTSEAAKIETVYDDQDNVVEVRHPRYFDANDANGYEKSKTTLVYTGRNLLKSKTEAPGTAEAATEHYTYNLDGSLATRVDPRENTWTTLWSPCCANRVTSQINPLAETQTSDFDYAGRLTYTQTLTGTDVFAQTTMRYDARGRITHHCVWLVSAGTVDPNNPPIAGENGVSAVNGLTTRYAYDDDLDDDVGLDDQFPTLLTGLNLGTGSDGSAILITDSTGRRIIEVLDGAGRQVRQAQLAANGTVLTSTTTTYDQIAAVSGFGDCLETTQTNALGHGNHERTDGAGRVIQTVDAVDFVTASTYDPNGNRLSFRDPNAVGQDCVYDAQNRDIECADTLELAESLSRTKEYDLEGNLVKETDAKENDTLYAYDARNRRLSTTNRLAGVTEFSYDEVGNLLSLTDAEDQSTSYTYDDANRKLSETYPDHVASTSPPNIGYGIVAFTYDGAGRMKTKTDQQGDYIRFVYDRGSRLVSREYRERTKQPTDPPNDTDSFTYDGAGHMLSADNERYDNTVEFTYDDAGRLATESLTAHGQTYTVTRAYDTANRLTELTYPDGKVVERSYTDRGQLEQVDYDGNLAASFDYDNGAREITRTFGNNLVTSRTYNDDDTTAAISTPNVTSFTYSYDDNKNKTAEAIGGVMSSYGFTATFDDEDRLASWTREDSNLTQSWELSLVGDWDEFTTNSVTQTRTHGNAHELTVIASTSLTCDAKGNLTTNSNGQTYTWDFDNRMASATVPNGCPDGVQGTHSYTYDALGRRVSRSVNGTDTTVFVCMTVPLPQSPFAGQELSEYDSGADDTNPERHFVYASYIDDVILQVNAPQSSPVKYFHHANNLFSCAGISNSAGSIVERYSTGAYGTRVIHDASGIPASATISTLGNNTGFTGRRIDGETALLHYRARSYSSVIGRFLSRDPLGFTEDHWSVYEYCHSTPICLLDPSGLTTVVAALKICASEPTYPQKVKCICTILPSSKCCSELQNAQQHLDKIKKAMDEIKALKDKLNKETVKKIQDQLRKEIDDLLRGKNGVNNHCREVCERWGKPKDPYSKDIVDILKQTAGNDKILIKTIKDVLKQIGW